MTDVVVNEHDLETPDSIHVRFGLTYLEADTRAATAAMTMYRNPFTGAPTIGPLAILFDAAAGIVNHYRRRPSQWTVSSNCRWTSASTVSATSTVRYWSRRTRSVN